LANLANLAPPISPQIFLNLSQHDDPSSKKRGNSWNPFSWFFEGLSRFFVILSGASYEELKAECPRWELRKYEAFGATVLVPAIFGMVASAYAVSTLTDVVWIIYGFALVWGGIILTIDRALLSSYRAYSSPAKKIPQVIMRFSVAFLLGFTIAHPLTLLLFQDTITAEVERSRTAEVEEIRLQAAENKKVLEERITQTAAALAEQQETYQETMSASFMDKKEGDTEAGPAMEVTGKDAVEEQIAQSTEAQRTQIRELDQQLSQHTERYSAVQEELTRWQQEYEAEIDGSRSGTAGIGPRAKSIQEDQLTPRRAEAQRLGTLLENLTNQRNQLSNDIAQIEKGIRDQFAAETAEEAAKIREDQQQVAALERQLKKQQLSIFVDKQDALLAQIQRQIDTHTEELSRLQAEATQLSADTQEQIAMVQNQRRMDMLTQTLALHHLFENGDEGGHFALSVYIILAALFMLIDTIPIIVKLFSNPGHYDLMLALRDPATRRLIEFKDEVKRMQRVKQLEIEELKMEVELNRVKAALKRKSVSKIKQIEGHLEETKEREVNILAMEKEIQEKQDELHQAKKEARRKMRQQEEEMAEEEARDRLAEIERKRVARARAKEIQRKEEELETEEELVEEGKIVAAPIAHRKTQPAAPSADRDEVEHQDAAAFHPGRGKPSVETAAIQPSSTPADEESGGAPEAEAPRDEEVMSALGGTEGIRSHVEKAKAAREEKGEEVAEATEEEEVEALTEEEELAPEEAVAAGMVSGDVDEGDEIITQPTGGFGEMLSNEQMPAEEPPRRSYEDFDAKTEEVDVEAMMPAALAAMQADPTSEPDVDPPLVPEEEEVEAEAPEVVFNREEEDAPQEDVEAPVATAPVQKIGGGNQVKAESPKKKGLMGFLKREKKPEPEPKVAAKEEPQPQPKKRRPAPAPVVDETPKGTPVNLQEGGFKRRLVARAD